MNTMNTFVLNGTSEAAVAGNNREITTIFADAAVVGKNIEKIAVAVRTALKMHEISETKSLEGFYIECIDAVATLFSEIGEYDGWVNSIPETADHDYYMCGWEFLNDNYVFRRLARATANYSCLNYREARRLFMEMATDNMLEEFSERHPEYNVADIAGSLLDSTARGSIKELLKDMYKHFKAEGITEFGYEPTDAVQISVEDIPVIAKML